MDMNNADAADFLNILSTEELVTYLETLEAADKYMEKLKNKSNLERSKTNEQ